MPVAGLPIAAVILVALVVAIATDRLWALEFFHVAFGGLWTGVDLFLGFIVGPIIARMSIGARVEFSTRLMPKMVLLMPVLVTVTLTAGWQLASHLGYTSTEYFNHDWLVASYVVVGVMAIVALGVLEPANIAVLYELRKPAPDGELIARLMRRFVVTAGITGAMQVATLVIMTKIASGA
ncbi:hypothetical protein DSM104329_01436 [Capillimicrobium parvum]|uniref:Uncharacterized protein n=1 Tax=Capillimicrobium parvum TaxID=2884022 RepID=A0A9E7C010_9ACTN|nr:hypothetical protein DSM104329_01436 [Capillimicrobium parvum]